MVTSGTSAKLLCTGSQYHFRTKNFVGLELTNRGSQVRVLHRPPNSIQTQRVLAEMRGLFAWLQRSYSNSAE